MRLVFLQMDVNNHECTYVKYPLPNGRVVSLWEFREGCNISKGFSTVCPQQVLRTRCGLQVHKCWTI